MKVLLLDLKTYDDQEFAEAYAAASYDVNRLRDSFDRDLPPEEIEIERKYVLVFDKSCGNLVMNMLKYISEKCEGDERTYIEKECDEIASAYRSLLLANNASGFDMWVVLKLLDKEIKNLKK